MKQKHFFFYLFFTFISTLVFAQSSPFIGTWQGEIRGFDDDLSLIWRAKIKVTSSTSAELLLYDDNKGTYVSYLTDSRFSGQKRKVSFISSGITASLVLSYESSTMTGQSVYNMLYDSKTQMASVLWSNMHSDMTEYSKVLGYGDFTSDNSPVYSGSKLLVGGQSYSYIKIDKIAVSDQQTAVTFTITNNSGEDINGTFHEPGHPTAFYITNADRSVKYKLRSADKSLPKGIKIEPGKSFTITLYFDPTPKSMKVMNIFEGGDPTTELWKFFDIVLKD